VKSERLTSGRRSNTSHRVLPLLRRLEERVSLKRPNVISASVVVIIRHKRWATSFAAVDLEALLKAMKGRALRGATITHSTLPRRGLRRSRVIAARSRQNKTPKKQQNPMSAIRSEPTHHEIAVCAYCIWEQEGRPEGRALDHWMQAELQLVMASILRQRRSGKTKARS
jgi:Protein of unknown function (DUF2934)